MRHIAALLCLLIPSLADAATLSGIVADKEGKPIKGATVTPATAAVREGTSPLCPSCYSDCAKSATTDASGKFAIPDVDDALVFNLLVASPGYRATYAKRTDPRNGDAKITLSRPEANATALRGRVLDPEGRPVFGAMISPNGYTKGQGTGYGGFPGDQMAVTDREGNFELICTDPAVDGLGVLISAPQLARRVFSPLPLGKDSQTYNLDRGVKIQGRLMRDGKGVPNANVTIVQQDRSAETSLDTQVIGTDIDGKFELSNVPAGVLWILSANRDSLTENGAAASLPFLSTEADTEMTLPDLVVERGLVIEGQVRLADGNPIPPNTRILIDREPDWDPQTRILDAEGRFRFAARAGEKISFYTRVPNYTETLRMANGRTIGPELVVTPKTTSIEINLERVDAPSKAGTLSGVVLSSGGKPAAGAQVYLLSPQDHLTIQNGAPLSKPRVSQQTVADAEGHFAIPGALNLPPKFLTLVALHETGFAVAPFSAPATLDLTPWVTVEGRARLGDKDLAGQTVKIAFPTSQDESKASIFFQAIATTHDNGAYKIKHGIPGVALIGVLDGRNKSRETYHQQIGTEITAGQVNHVDLGGKGIAVHGRIDIPEEVLRRTVIKESVGQLNRQLPPYNPPADPKAAAVQSLRRFLDHQEYSFDIKPDGSFTIPDVTSGTYSLTVPFPDKASTEKYMRDSAGIYFAIVKVPPDSKDFVIKHSDFRVRKPQLAAGDKIPEFAATSTSGQSISSESLQGRPGVVIFALNESDRNTDLANALTALGSLPGSKPFVLWVGGGAQIPHAEGWDVVSAADSSKVREAFGVQITPTYFIFAKDGRLAAQERRQDAFVRAVSKTFAPNFKSQ